MSDQLPNNAHAAGQGTTMSCKIQKPPNFSPSPLLVPKLAITAGLSADTRSRELGT